MIPPTDPSGSLRVAYLLRVTSDIMDAIPSYPLADTPPLVNVDDPDPMVPPPIEDTLVKVVDVITDLDKGWLAVLNSQAWDPKKRKGTVSAVATRGPTQTDKTRLSSIIRLGKEGIMTWLTSGTIVLPEELEDEFASIFWRTEPHLEINPSQIADSALGQDQNNYASGDESDESMEVIG